MARVKLSKAPKAPSASGLKAPSGRALNVPIRFSSPQRGSEAYEEQAQAATSEVQDIDWASFLGEFSSLWKQGEHVTLYAATGQGKTTLALEILPIRQYMMVFATKQKYQRLFVTLQQQGFKVMTNFDNPPNPDVTPKVILHCAPKDLGAKSTATQQRVYGKALDYIYKAGGWGLYLDELKYVTDNLKLGRSLELLYLQGRELGVSIIGTSQRPAWVPVVAIAEATHLFIGAQSDQRDIDRIAEGSGRKGRIIRPLIDSLEDYQFLYVHTRNSKVPVYRVKVELNS